MPHFTTRVAAAFISFVVGLTAAWLSGLVSTLEAATAEWLVPTSEVNVPARPLVGREEADYEVYRTVLREMFGGNSKDATLVIRRDLSDCGFCRGSRVTKFDGAAAETLDDFNIKNSVPRVIPPAESYALVYKFLDDEEFGEIFRGRDAGGWQVFYERFPRASGYITLSAVGFNRNYDEAFLYAANDCGRGLCGSGWHVLLRKDAGGWKIESTSVIWQY